MARLLVVDDEPDIRDAMADLLSQEGFEVFTACDGRAALETAARADHLAVILLDLMMPRMNGWQFRAAQKSDPRIADVPVIIVSATPDPGLDADGVLQKPFGYAELMAAVHSAVDHPRH